MSNDRSSDELAPWRDRRSSDWLCAWQSWRSFTKYIRRTLEHDPRKFPHQVRAAAGLVILLARPGMWPDAADLDELEDLAGLARRQLTQIKQQYSAEARHNPEISGSAEFRALIKSLDEEMRCLDARVADRALLVADQPPATWGKFFPE
jgi:hypothetical protein